MGEASRGCYRLAVVKPAVVGSPPRTGHYFYVLADGNVRLRKGWALEL
ncbi:hypothetical protein [Nonomuraea dietziae]